MATEDSRPWMKAGLNLPSSVMADLTAAFSLEAAGAGGGLYTDKTLGNFRTKQVAKRNDSQRTGCPGATAAGYRSGRPGCTAL